MVKELREISGAGMMDCKKALTETNGDLEEAIDFLRKNGTKIANKKASRDTNDGLVAVKISDRVGYVVEVNCETDFVAHTEGFQDFVSMALNTFAGNIDTTEIIAKVGENVRVGGMAMLVRDTVLVSYVHNQIADGMGKIGVVVNLRGQESDELTELGRQIAMHIAATNPLAVSVQELDPEFIEREKKIFTEQALESGKPENIVEKMVEGKMKKTIREVTLMDQPFVINPDTTVGKALEEAGAMVVDFIRMEVGN